MGRQTNNDEFQIKIDKAFPADGLAQFPAEGLGDVVLACRNLAEAMMYNIPHSRERSLAFSRLEECFLWAALGVVRK